MNNTRILHDKTLLTEEDLYLFNEGSHFQLYRKLGAHVFPGQGTYFAVWAPNAEEVFVEGDFNGWNPHSHPLRPRGSSGIWEGFLPGVGHGMRYKYFIRSRHEGYCAEKADPFAFHAECPPMTASVIWDLDYRWRDKQWMHTRERYHRSDAPISVYEVHLGSWMRSSQEEDRLLTYRELAGKLAPYVKEMGFTHVEFLPVMEHPFYGSWGYQSLGYFAPTSRYGTPQDFMALVDRLHRLGVGVILDWVPSHFPDDVHGLAFFDGTHLFEHADPRQGLHPEWHSRIFNYGRNEVRSFLISSALFWLEQYHADGLRVDAVASMLYLDYGRAAGEWIPNVHGGNENLEAIGFLRRLNEAVYQRFPDVQTIAEESTAWPMVSRPAYAGGLGFGMKWDMGWMHDTLQYLSMDPLYRRYHHNQLTFRSVYAFSENFLLPLSHDEVVYGKGSLLGKMPGDRWQKFAHLRLLFCYMYAQPGKKLVFMGGEFGQVDEWYHEKGLDWHLLKSPFHRGVQRLLQDLNRIYCREPALHQRDFDSAGFEWIEADDSERSVLSFLRKGPHTMMAAVFNFTPCVREQYLIGVPEPGAWKEIINSDAKIYAGSGVGNLGGVQTEPRPHHGQGHSLSVTLPPLGALFFRSSGTL